MRMKTYVVPAIIAALACFSAAPAGAGADEDAIKKIIQHQGSSIIKGDLAGIKSDFAEDGSITDEVPPFYWHGSSMVDAWWADLGKEMQEQKMALVKAKIGSYRSLVVAGDSAYAVADVALTVKQGDATLVEKGVWTFALAKRGSDWKIVASDWGGSVPKPVK